MEAGNFRSVDDVARAAFALLRENSNRRDHVRAELGALFAEMDEGRAIPTTDDGFARMVHEKAAKYSGQRCESNVTRRSTPTWTRRSGTRSAERAPRGRSRSGGRRRRGRGGNRAGIPAHAMAGAPGPRQRRHLCAAGRRVPAAGSTEREKGFEPSTSTLAIAQNGVSSRYWAFQILEIMQPGVTRATQLLRRSGAPGGAPGWGAPLGTAADAMSASVVSCLELLWPPSKKPHAIWLHTTTGSSPN
jgi:Arc/MetJ-type ribon-helix-helix transcriptional regulator